MNDRDYLHRQLAALPDPELPEHLWTRVSRARARRLRRRWGAGTAALALALVAIAMLSLQSVRQPTPASTRVVQSDAQPHNGRAQQVQVRALDRKLQAAYRRNASDAEIAQLWVTRRALLDRSGGSPATPVRI